MDAFGLEKIVRLLLLLNELSCTGSLLCLQAAFVVRHGLHPCGIQPLQSICSSSQIKSRRLHLTDLNVLDE